MSFSFLEFAKEETTAICCLVLFVKNQGNSRILVGPRLARWFGTSNLCKLLHFGNIRQNGTLRDFTNDDIYRRWLEPGALVNGYEEHRPVPMAMFTDG